MARRSQSEIRKLFSLSPLSRDYGLELKPSRNGKASAAMRVETRQTQGLQRVHGGVLTALADTAATYAAYSAIDKGEHLLTLSLSMSFISGASEGEKLEATGIVEHVGRRTVVARAEVAGRRRRLVASGTFTMLRCRDGSNGTEEG